jgi:hypothetical protein
MQLEAGDIHVGDRLRRIERCQLQAKTSGVINPDARRAARFIKPPQTFVPERFDHALL